MNPVETTIFNLVRLGLEGDAASIRQLARRIMRQSPVSADGEPSLRSRLAELLTQQPHTATRGTVLQSPVDGGSFLSLARTEQVPIADIPELTPEALHVLEAVLQERTAARELMNVGIEPTKSILLTGPPGVGKTMTARYLASRLGLPLVSLDLAALISSYLGKTGQNLRQALDYARAFPCVLLLDEFDAIGKRRDDPADIGELKRIVNVLLLELETWPSYGVLVAATNHPELLDRAVWRRFDRVLPLTLPSLEARHAILRRTAEDLGRPLNPEILELCARALDGASGSDVVRILREAVRAAVIQASDLNEALVNSVLGHVSSLRDGREPDRVAYAALAHLGLKLTVRAVAERLGVTHVTIINDLKKWKEHQKSLGMPAKTKGRGRPRKSQPQ